MILILYFQFSNEIFIKIKFDEDIYQKHKNIPIIISILIAGDLFFGSYITSY